MTHWAGVISAADFTTERLYARDAVLFPATVDAALDGSGPAVGDQVVLLARTELDQTLLAFGVGRVAITTPAVAVRYTFRLLDEPVPVDLNRPVGLSPLTRDDFGRVSPAAPPSPAGERDVWFVSVAIPIEASSRPEAVREFWTYVDKLGPRELPAYVWPRGDELAMQAFVLGEVANQDPEEEDE